MKLRSIQSEGHFLALDSAPRKREGESSGPSRKLLNGRACAARIVYVDTTHTVSTGHAYACSCVDTHAPTPSALLHRSHTHTRPGRLAAGSVGEAEERIPCSPPFVPRTPEQRADDQWNRESGAVPLVSANMAALRLAHPPADTVRRKIHFVRLSSILPFPPIVPRTFHCRGAPRATSPLASQPPEISRCSDPRNSDRIDTSIALFSVNARHGPTGRRT